MTPAQLDAIFKATDAVKAAVNAAGPLGVGESYVHLALQNFGASTATCAQIVDLLVEAGKIRRVGHQLFGVKS